MFSLLTALHQNQTIYVNDYSTSYLKSLSDSKSLFCPDCGDVLIFKAYSQKCSHFSHVKRDCSYPFREPESIEHESGKLAIFDWMKHAFGENDCAIEKHVELTNQRSDTFIHSLQSAVEFQCSPIQESTWKTRNLLYKKASVTDIWVLGYSMHKRYAPLNRFAHKLNGLEETLLNEYGKIIYFDVLTKQFVFLFIEEKMKNYYIGDEFFFKPSEVFIKDGEISSKYDYFIHSQKNRTRYSTHQLKSAKYTDDYLKGLREEISEESEKILASKKQINYIKFLLYQNGKTIPYKLHGLLKDEADSIIKKLIEEKEMIK